MPNEVVSPNDSKINSLSCNLLCLLRLLICFIGIFNFLIIKIFLTRAAMTKLVSERWRLHRKLAWVSTICHETKQASLSNLSNINNSMPHFYTCVGGSQCCRFWPFLKPSIVLCGLTIAQFTWSRALRGPVQATGIQRESTIRPMARPNRCSAETLHNT